MAAPPGDVTAITDGHISRRRPRDAPPAPDRRTDRVQYRPRDQAAFDFSSALDAPLTMNYASGKVCHPSAF